MHFWAFKDVFPICSQAPENLSLCQRRLWPWFEAPPI